MFIAQVRFSVCFFGGVVHVALCAQVTSDCHLAYAGLSPVNIGPPTRARQAALWWWSSVARSAAFEIAPPQIARNFTPTDEVI